MAVSVTTATRPAVGVRSALTAGAVAAVGAAVVNGAISLVARGPLGVSAEFVPLTPGPIVLWTVIGALVGAAGWRLIVNRSARSGAVLRALVPTVLVLSLIPDVALLVTGAMPGTTTTAVLALMVMHVVTAAIAVTAYRRTMPTS
jgi:uncharacterized protein DUF6069